MDFASKASDPEPISNKTNNTYTTCMLYDKEDLKNMLRDLTVITHGQINQENPSTSLPTATVDEVLKDLKISSALSCSSCHTQFSSHSEQRAHFKTEWHRHNLKQKLKGVESITQDEFDSRNSCEPDTGEGSKTPPRRKVRRPKPSGLPAHLAGRASPTPSNSSSSTDSEEEFSSDADDDPDVRRNPKQLFKNGAGKVLAVYRCVLHGKQTFPSHDGELIRSICTLHQRLNWAVILVGGGHFAAAVFNGKDIVAHKTFHRYTVRAKQGSSQSSRDGRQSGGAPRSGGASLRRQNEATLVQDVQVLLELWDLHLKKSHIVFFRAPGSNKAILFGGKVPPFKKGDDRLRPIPFPTCRATLQEVQRIHHVLSSVTCYESLEAAITGSLKVMPFHNRFSPVHKPKRKKEKNDQASVGPKNRQEEPPSDTFPGVTDSDEGVKFLSTEETFDMNELKMFDSSEGKRKPRKGRKYRPS